MKQIISFLLKKVPRKYLQLISHYLLKVVAVFYKGNKVECPVCESRFKKFLPYGRVGRSNALCPTCLSLERHRLIWYYLKDKTDFFTAEHRMLHVAPEYCFIKRFDELQNLDYITADIESPLAKIKMDIHEIPFKENEFDIIFCNHVLEHVDNDIQAMKEIYRTLKPGGWAILLIPLFYPLPEHTIEDPSIKDPQERERLFGQDDHVRKYGMDYVDRLKNVGFQVEQNYVKDLPKKTLERYAINESEILFVAHKN